MIGKYICEQCGWEGDSPATAYPEYEDGGYPCCPHGCLSPSDNDFEGVVLNPANSENQMRYLRTLSAVIQKRGGLI